MPNIERYKFLWENVSRYFLVPGDSSYKRNPRAEYVIYEKLLIHRSKVLVHEDLFPMVIKKMIEAGVEIITEPIVWEKFTNIERLWTELVDELALIPIKNRKGRYKICHKDTDQIFEMRIDPYENYQKIIENMINAGVEILDET